MADQFRYCLGGIRRVASAKRFRAVECRETKKGAGLALSIFPGELIQGIFAINSSPCGTFSGEKEREREREGEGEREKERILRIRVLVQPGLSGTRLENGVGR